MRTCALTYQIKGPKTVNEAKIGLFRKIAILHVTVGGLLIWYDSAQVRMWIILNINHNPRCVQEPWDILVVQNRTQGRCVMFLTENELFAQFVFLLGLKYTFFGKNILLGQSTSLGHSATGQPGKIKCLGGWVGWVATNFITIPCLSLPDPCLSFTKYQNATGLWLVKLLISV